MILPPLPVLHPPPPNLAALLGDMLDIALPGGPLLLPATLHPMLLFVAGGEIRLDRGGALAPAGLLGGCAGIRLATASPGARVLMAWLKPGQLPRLLGISAADAFDAYLPLDLLLPPAWLSPLTDAAGSALRPRAEALLCRLATQHGHRAPTLALPSGWPARSAGDLAAHFGLSLRQFERRFRASAGQSLRAFRPQARLNRLLLNARWTSSPDWADVAVAAGYADQAHLHRDFVRYAGRTPSAYIQSLGGDDPALRLYRLPREAVLRMCAEPGLHA
ncbi:AraC family transcriptional regulator [Chromobacterium vaccinii]|uniref:helix-turn-helix domain-containing protein n=1 Tax=Chromobacterium vaccinii TaxID=1108595 RepID=UPI001E5648EA|nr:AraC family transcriptional regulator [Chromobacterium vaccinii]MCD4486385.1 AraC family transcriptional regulator [Chromobacterium vaccinii]